MSIFVILLMKLFSFKRKTGSLKHLFYLRNDEKREKKVTFLNL